MVKRAVQSEMTASREDHSLWRYRDDEGDKGIVSIVVETNAGSVKRLITRNGKPLSDAEAKAEDERVQAFVHDSAKLAKQKKDGASDDKNAAELLRMLPEAFTWKLARENAETVTLGFEPDPTFNPPDMQSRVMGTMAASWWWTRRQHRIKTIQGDADAGRDDRVGAAGAASQQGGTFDVERREVKPGLWQITETHVHIDGNALFFKTIGQQQDEVQTDFRAGAGGDDAGAGGGDDEAGAVMHVAGRQQIPFGNDGQSKDRGSGWRAVSLRGLWRRHLIRGRIVS